MKSRKTRWNPHFARMKSSHADEIKSTLSPDEVGFHPRSGFHHWKWFHPPVRVDLVEKNPCLSMDKQGLFSGAGNVTRTRDLRITNALLYQLSYSSRIVFHYSTKRVIVQGFEEIFLSVCLFSLCDVNFFTVYSRNIFRKGGKYFINVI